MNNELVSKRDNKTYKDKWVKRFDFYNLHGAPNSDAFKLALKDDPKKRKLIEYNFIAFFLGPFYLFVLGLWKKNLSLLFIGFTINVVTLGLPPIFGIFGKLVTCTLYGVITNYAYYLKEIKGEQGWNPFKGIFKGF